MLIFFSSNCIYILNDKHVEFRKAIADGKKIKMYLLQKEDEFDEDKDIYDWVELKDIDYNYSFEENSNLYTIV